MNIVRCLSVLGCLAGLSACSAPSPTATAGLGPAPAHAPLKSEAVLLEAIVVHPSPEDVRAALTPAR
jgi:hypothetical protein